MIGINPSRLTPMLTLALSIAIGAAHFAVADDPPMQQKSKTTAAKKVEKESEAKVKEIIVRLKSRKGTLPVYLDEKRAYVAGKSVTKDELIKVIKRTNARILPISADPSVKFGEIRNFVKVAHENGIMNVEIVARKPRLKEVAQENREKAAEKSEAKLREILARQKGDDLKVYLKGSRIYVNGKSVTPDELSTLVRESGLKQSKVTAGEGVTPKRVREIESFIQKIRDAQEMPQQKR